MFWEHSHMRTKRVEAVKKNLQIKHRGHRTLKNSDLVFADIKYNSNDISP